MFTFSVIRGQWVFSRRITGAEAIKGLSSCMAHKTLEANPNQLCFQVAMDSKGSSNDPINGTVENWLADKHTIAIETKLSTDGKFCLFTIRPHQ